MKKAFPTILIGFALIALLDVLGSIASNRLNFNYAILAPISYIIYTVIPFNVSRQSNRKAAILSGSLTALFDVTIGLKLSIMLHANTGNFHWNTITLPTYIVLVLFMIILGLLFGLLGHWIATKFSRKKSSV